MPLAEVRAKTTGYLPLHRTRMGRNVRANSSFVGQRIAGTTNQTTRRIRAPSIFPTLPKFKNWVEEGAVTPVRRQGPCGSCWAFSAVGVVESHNFIKHGKRFALSEQHLLDCGSQGKYAPNDGCAGGHQSAAFRFIRDNRGIARRKEYPDYIAIQGPCRHQANMKGADFLEYKTIPSGDELDLQMAVAYKGPVSVGIHLTEKFKLHKSGVFYDEEWSRYHKLEHAMLVVGYGTDDNNQDYWLVKNSWGKTSWGENAYIKMARNMNNHCGIAKDALYPVV